MKSIEDYFEIRKARYDEIEDIMSYLDQYWKKGHVLSKSRKLFEYEFVDDEQNVNMYICRDKSTNEICAIEGYIYTAKDEKYRDAWGAIWHARSNNKILLLGTYLREKMIGEIGIRHFVGVGDNPNTSLKIAQKSFKEYVCRMDHFYILNDISNYKIAKVVHKNTQTISPPKDIRYQFKEIKDASSLNRDFTFARFQEQVPYLDSYYITHRYLNHPIYKYEIYGAYSTDDNTCDALFIFRRIHKDGHIAYRLMRFVGDEEVFNHSYHFFNNILKDKTIEYIDFYCAGFEKEYIINAGFDLITESDTNIIPNYFEPFVRENIDIYCDSTYEHTFFCKGDADQDRPNSVPDNFN